ncbi:putative GTP cyclohydrolase 1 type 2 [Pedobacter glucosidilyticus]|nr:Nif3-like dinuclear metal center hexameric protein [Pedobacter glucosidilyticus]KHJ38327.1 putative GTP cyclohydrolase 1 type 2 [Pedobacter glucosidilyticus]
MKIKELSTFLESIAPASYQEAYDNAGLIVGHPHQEIKKALICLDCTEAVVQEAIDEQCDIIIAHHPIVFKGLKKFNGKNYVERVVIKAIKHDIAIYAIHTNLDHVYNGVNKKIADKLGLINTQILAPREALLKKLVVFVPTQHKEQVKEALFTAGAGSIGNYTECSFEQAGQGNYKANESANPFLGEKNKRHTEEEYRLEVLIPAHLEHKIVAAMLQAHPYEEVAYDLFPISNTLKTVGAGMFGQLEVAMDEAEFLKLLKQNMQVSVIRHTALLGKKISKVAVCGGSGSFLLQQAIQAGADIFITADFKYHEFFDADGKIIIADIGHFESEQFTQDLLLEIIQNNFPNFALRLTVHNTNPIKYLS